MEHRKLHFSSVCTCWYLRKALLDHRRKLSTFILKQNTKYKLDSHNHRQKLPIVKWFHNCSDSLPSNRPVNWLVSCILDVCIMKKKRRHLYHYSLLWTSTTSSAFFFPFSSDNGLSASFSCCVRAIVHNILYNSKNSDGTFYDLLRSLDSDHSSTLTLSFSILSWIGHTLCLVIGRTRKCD